VVVRLILQLSFEYRRTDDTRSRFGNFFSAAALAFWAILVDASAKLQISLRLVHILAGILLVGLLYSFTLVSLRFLRELDAATRLRIYARPGLNRRPLRLG
jgi:hypothetical protein